MDLSTEEKSHLADLTDRSLHHAVLDEAMSHLSDQDKRAFVKLLSEDPGGEHLWDFLNQRVEKIEDKIKKVSDDLMEELYQDLKEAKKISI